MLRERLGTSLFRVAGSPLLSHAWLITPVFRTLFHLFLFFWIFFLRLFEILLIFNFIWWNDENFEFRIWIWSWKSRSAVRKTLVAHKIDTLSLFQSITLTDFISFGQKNSERNSFMVRNIFDEMKQNVENICDHEQTAPQLTNLGQDNICNLITR